MARPRKVTPALFAQPRTCGGKNCYPTKQQATRVKTEQELLVPGLTLAIYHCPQCSSWHLTRGSGRDNPAHTW